MMRNHALLQTLPQMRRQLERREVGARRMQFYFAQLSEAVTAEDFARVLEALPVVIPLSTKAQYSLEEAAAARISVGAKKAAAAAAATNNVANANDAVAAPSTSGATALSSSAPVAFSYVDFTYRASPLRCMSDEVSVGLAGPVAVLRMERLSPFLEEAALFVQRKRDAAMPAFKRRKEDRRKKQAIAAASAAALAQAGIGAAATHMASSAGATAAANAHAVAAAAAMGSVHRRHKRKRSHHRKHQLHTRASESSLVAAAAAAAAQGEQGGHHQRSHRHVRPKSEHPPPATAAAAASPSAHSDHTSKTGSDRSGSIDGSNSGDSDSSSSSSSDDDESDAEDDPLLSFTSGPLSFPPPSQYHLASCAAYELDGDAPQPLQQAAAAAAAAAGGGLLAASSPGGIGVPSSGASATSSSISAAMVGGNGAGSGCCACPPMQAVSLSVQVNAEFERLFGFPQADVRALFMKEGTRALQRYITWRQTCWVCRLALCCSRFRLMFHVFHCVLCVCV
jgi:hypothetical protein